MNNSTPIRLRQVQNHRRFRRVRDRSCGGELGKGGELLFPITSAPSSAYVAGRCWVFSLRRPCRGHHRHALGLLPGAFEKLDFRYLDRSGVPSSIRATLQFAGLCPETAVSMRIRLAGHSHSRKAQEPGERENMEPWV